MAKKEYQVMSRNGKDLINDNGFAEELINDDNFKEFILREAERTIVHASVEDLAIFGFGSLEDALEAYQEHLEE